jgi:hypothetical protein
MAYLNFPLNPALGDTYSIGNKVWIWNGRGWALQKSEILSEIISTTPLTVVSTEITTTTNSTSTTTGALTVVGGIGIGGDVVIGGGIVIGDSLTNSVTAPAVLVNSPINLDSFAVTRYRTAKYVVQIVDLGYTPNLVHSCEILVTHDNNGVDTLGYIVQYAIVTNFGELGTWDSVYSAGNLVLRFTPNYSPANMLVKVTRTVLTA